MCADLGAEASDAVGDVLASSDVEDGVVVVRLPLTDSVADMNLFVDTDGDGIVNASDDDDDGYGTPDSTDETPYESDLTDSAEPTVTVTTTGRS